MAAAAAAARSVADSGEPIEGTASRAADECEDPDTLACGRADATAAVAELEAVVLGEHLYIEPKCARSLRSGVMRSGAIASLVGVASIAASCVRCWCRVRGAAAFAGESFILRQSAALSSQGMKIKDDRTDTDSAHGRTAAESKY